MLHKSLWTKNSFAKFACIQWRPDIITTNLVRMAPIMRTPREQSFLKPLYLDLESFAKFVCKALVKNPYQVSISVRKPPMMWTILKGAVFLENRHLFWPGRLYEAWTDVPLNIDDYRWKCWIGYLMAESKNWEYNVWCDWFSWRCMIGEIVRKAKQMILLCTMLCLRKSTNPTYVNTRERRIHIV